MREGRDSVMLETIVLNYSARSTGVLVALGIGVFLGIAEIMVVGS